MTKSHMFFGGVGCGMFIAGASGFSVDDPRGFANGVVAVVGLGLILIVVIHDKVTKK